jgi:ATP-binding cassette subfamily B protein
MTRHSLRKSYGMVLQDTWIRNGTVKENIAIGMPDATDEQIIAAAKSSHAHSFIKRLPKGYDTVLTENGSILSQGQKQLLCIARIMLCLPPMLILDEATSSIDTRTEIKIQEALNELMTSRTCFIIAHRLSTIQNADTILVLQNGEITEQGNHEELMRKGGFYSTLYNSQFN